MSISIICPQCDYEIPEHFSRCPRCGYSITTIRQPVSDDFRVWEGDYTVVDVKYDKRDHRPPKSAYPQNYEVCKCLGTIDEMECGTYYFVSSVMAHGGCARRDCSNSFENGIKVTVDWGDKKASEHKGGYTWLNVLLGMTGLVMFLIGVADESAVIVLGIILFIVAAIPYGSAKREYEKVNFQLVKRSDIPRSAKDPWKQTNILKTIERHK